MDDNNRIVRLNIGGRIFESMKSTFTKYPETLLGKCLIEGIIVCIFKILTGSIPESAVMLDDDTLFFDRDPYAFEVVMKYYRYGTMVL
jgi:hypothetical protein